MIDQVRQDFKTAASTATADLYVDPSIQYAEALLNGKKDIVVTTRDGQHITYVFGRERRLSR